MHDDFLLRELRNAAASVTQALNDLLSHVRSIRDRKRAPKRTDRDSSVDTILSATDRLCSSTGDASEMVRQAKVLAQATASLIHNIKGQAETQPDSDIRKKLLVAAKMLADATSRLVKAAKGCASNPRDSDSQAALRQAAQDLRNATNTAATNAFNVQSERTQERVQFERPHEKTQERTVERSADRTEGDRRFQSMEKRSAVSMDTVDGHSAVRRSAERHETRTVMTTRHTHDGMVNNNSVTATRREMSSQERSMFVSREAYDATITKVMEGIKERREHDTNTGTFDMHLKAQLFLFLSFILFCSPSVFSLRSHDHF